MNLSRRLFLGGVLSIVGATFVDAPSLGAEYPTIYADGVHDDTEGLKAFFAGKPFHVEEFNIVAENGKLRNGTLIVTETLSVPAYGFSVDNCIVFNDDVAPFAIAKRGPRDIGAYDDLDLYKHYSKAGPEALATYLDMTGRSYIDNLVLSRGKPMKEHVIGTASMTVGDVLSGKKMVMVTGAPKTTFEVVKGPHYSKLHEDASA